MEKKIKSIANPKLSLNILTSEEVQQIHTATLDIIETAGVRFPSPKAIDILEDHGAQVDRNSMVARIPGNIIEEY
ncbi:MAG: trimethylamine methyltransferase family protein, partial [Anaerolineales bacterium]